MIYIFGDSHGLFNFKNLKLTHQNLQRHSTTMHRIGRDKVIINFDAKFNGADNIFILAYGEVDCRCHVKRQMNLGHECHDVIKKLVDDYVETIKANIVQYKKIVLCCIIPPVKKEDNERLNGPITHEFPIVGSDQERVTFAIQTNLLLKKACDENGWTYLDFYEHYQNSSEDQTLNFELSDKNIHVGDNTHILSLVEQICQ